MNINESALPGYRRVKQILFQQITEGGLKPGDRIISERALAESLGISRLTVSRAIGELVNEGLLKRRHGSGTYVADWRSRTPTVKTGHIGLVLPHTTDVPSSELIRGVTTALRGTGYHTIFADSGNKLEQEAELLNSLRKDQVDGLIIMPVDHVADIPIFQEMTYSGLPFVFVDRFVPNVECDYVVTDNHWASFQATKWLIERGHQRIAHFTIFNSKSSVVCQRLQGYFDALTHFGIPHDPDLLCPPSVYEHRVLAYKHALSYVRNLPEPATAVFAMNDTVVWSTLQAVADLGLRMPEDVEMAGFFDSGGHVGINASFLKVVQPFFEMGRTAAEILIDAINNRGEHEIQRKQLKPSLVASGVPLTVVSDSAVDI
ncbi:MAG: GntR family transcriptional regulator [Armatimonadota bacterium]|nr:GntR family transcriptional regulator [Armatimonadota bacterium]